MTVEPATWNIIGLDSNTPEFGPNRFPVGAKVCNPDGASVSGATAVFYWDSSNPYVDLRGGTDTLTLPLIPPYSCTNAIFEVEVVQDSSAFDTTRRYHINVNGISTPEPRELYIEHLVSQGRNAVTDIKVDGVSIPAGGSMNLVTGNTYTIELVGYTATQGYQQLESFINFPITIFQIESVESIYSSPTDPYTIDALYSDACQWVNDPGSPNYRSCVSDAKAGGNITVTYRVKIRSVGRSRESLSTLIHDFSGSSFHYNSDYSTSARFANIIDPTAVAIAKAFSPATTSAGGVSTLTFEITNPNAGLVSGLTFTDVFPLASAGSYTMSIAATPGSSTCGGTLWNQSETSLLSVGDNGIKLTGGTVPGNSSCTVQVTVTAYGPASGSVTYSNTSGHLFVGGIDTGDDAQATLTVDNSFIAAARPPNSCPGQEVIIAEWQMPSTGAGSGGPPPPYSFLATEITSTLTTASYTAGNGGTSSIITTYGTPSVNSWGATGWYPDPTGPPLFPSYNTAPYFDFVIDTSKYGGVFVSFNYLLMPNGSWGAPGNNMLYVYSSDDGNQPFQTIYSGASTKNTPWRGPVSATAAKTGAYTTTFRINGTGASTAAGTMHIDNIVFKGCALPATPPSPPTITKSFVPGTIGVGLTSTLTFTITNPNAGSALSEISFTDNLPAGLELASSVTTTQCGGTVTGASGTGTISLTSGVTGTGAAATCTVVASVKATTTGPHNNVSGFVSARESGTNLTLSGFARATLTALLPPDITKSFGMSSIYTGSTTTVSFSILNSNLSNTLTGVAFTDTLPLGITVADSTSSQCNGTLTATSGSPGTIVLSGGSIAPSNGCTVSAVVTGATASTNAWVNSVQVTSANGGTGNTSSAQLLVSDRPTRIELSKQVSRNSTGPWSSYLALPTGMDLYYRFTVENTGENPLSSVLVSDPTLTLPVVDPGACAWSASVNPLPVSSPTTTSSVFCVKGPLAASSGLHPNTATAQGTYGATTVYSSSTATYATASLLLTKSALESHFTKTGNVLHYNYTVTNDGYAPLGTSAAITDSKILSGITCSYLTTAVTTTNAPGDNDNYLDPNEKVTCTGTYTVVDGDVTAKKITNEATAAVQSIISSSATATVLLAPDLTINKANNVSGATNAGTSFTWTLTVSNLETAGTATFTDGQFILRDDLPDAGAVYSNVTTTTTGTMSGPFTCAVLVSTLTCTANGGPVTIPPGDTLSVVVTTTTSTGGTLQNPRTVDGCKVDPDGVLLEIEDDTNNKCSDSVLVRWLPSITILKFVSAFSDPINGESPAAKAIPGSVMTYRILATNSGPGAADDGTVTISDAIHDDTEFYMGDLGGAGSGPVLFTSGTGSYDSGLCYDYTGGACGGDSLTFYDSGGSPFAPALDGSFNSNIKRIELRFGGPFAESDGVNHPFFEVSFRVRVK